MLGHTLAVSFQTVAELLEGASRAAWGIAKRAVLSNTLTGLLILQSDQKVCEHWSEIRTLRKSRPIGVADAWIAATALAFGIELVTHNPIDFQGVPGLTIISECP